MGFKLQQQQQQQQRLWNLAIQYIITRDFATRAIYISFSFDGKRTQFLSQTEGIKSNSKTAQFFFSEIKSFPAMEGKEEKME